jgi:hypothetical protein
MKTIFLSSSQLIEGINLIEWQTCASEFPILAQCISMKRGPFQHKSQRPARQLTLDNFERLNAHLRARSAIFSVKVRGQVVVVLHRNDNAKEPADGRHFLPQFRFSVIAQLD